MKTATTRTWSGTYQRPSGAWERLAQTAKSKEAERKKKRGQGIRKSRFSSHGKASEGAADRLGSTPTNPAAKNVRDGEATGFGQFHPQGVLNFGRKEGRESEVGNKHYPRTTFAGDRDIGKREGKSEHLGGLSNGGKGTAGKNTLFLKVGRRRFRRAGNKWQIRRTGGGM